MTLKAGPVFNIRTRRDEFFDPENSFDRVKTPWTFLIQDPHQAYVEIPVISESYPACGFATKDEADVARKLYQRAMQRHHTEQWYVVMSKKNPQPLIRFEDPTEAHHFVLKLKDSYERSQKHVIQYSCGNAGLLYGKVSYTNYQIVRYVLRKASEDLIPLNLPPIAKGIVNEH